MSKRVNNKIGCDTRGLNIVDPNAFDGINSSSNISVATEDLNISVVLRTSRKGRSVLKNKSGVGTVEGTQNIEINFMDGSNINGEKVLTTKYTELTTIFDKGTINNETLGITNIDIDFNSSMTPMITINFVDVRGSSIFQNEEGIAGGSTSNKYSTFFQLPYPIFELEIKGYYGKPVTYCLHMLKFSSKFNSKSGNFEIQCEFIGYTYAMLSDMLIGFLKAIPYTKIGEEMYKKYRDNKSTDISVKNPVKILTLDELMTQISSINNGVAKIAGTSEDSSAINTIKEALDELGVIENIINKLGSDLQYGHTLKESSIPNNFKFIIKNSNLNQVIAEQENASIKTYKEEIKKSIDNFNSFNINEITLNSDDFTNITSKDVNKGYYTDLSKEMLSPEYNDTSIKQSLGSNVNGRLFKEELLSYLKTNYPDIRDNYLIDVYDMNSLFIKINETSKKLEEYKVILTKSLANQLKDNASSVLGFEPTVRNIIEIFTASIEVLMESIYSVSKVAESDKKRIEELKKVFSEDKSSDYNKNNLKANNYFAWPDYREYDEKTNTFVEKYLGSEGVLTDNTNVTELNFIDELFTAFITSAKKTTEAELINASSSAALTTWYPINPLDSKVFNSVEPYSDVNLINYLDVARVSLIRGIIFLGYSNDENIFSKDDIINMGILEGEAIMRNIKDSKLKKTLKNITLNTLIQSNGVINNVSQKVIVSTNDNFVYNFISKKESDGINSVILPISNILNKSYPTNKKGLISKYDDGDIFLTNYSNFKNNNGKKFDGCDYVKIIQPKDINTKFSLVTTSGTVKNETTLILNKLKDENVSSSAGFNPIGGSLGVPDFSKMDYGNGINLPLMYVFYRNYDNGLALTRESSSTSLYDYKSSGTIKGINASKTSLYKNTKNEYLHKSLGKNRELFSSIPDSGNSITYPYIEQRIFDSNNTGNIREPYEDNSFSLFGSQWYYFQDKAVCTLANNTKISCEQYSKAALFLNTLPFNIDHQSLIGTNANPFGLSEIYHLFDKQAGFIHAPRLWCAFIGSILWWLNDGEGIKYPIIEDGKIVGGGSGKLNPFIWILQHDTVNNKITNIKTPTRENYFPPVLSETGIINDLFEAYPKVEDSDILLKLPQQVKDEFKKCFFDFVNGSDELISWDSIREKFEIWGGTSDNFAKYMSEMVVKGKNKEGYPYYDVSVFSGLKNKDKYKVITLGYGSRNDSSHYFFLESKDNSSSVKVLIESLMQEKIIVNNNYKIWRKTDSVSTINYSDVSVSKSNFEIYFKSLISVLQQETENIYSEEKKIEQNLFGTTNNDIIKLMLYRTCKNIYDKWLAGVTNESDIMYQCGGASGRSIVDTSLGKAYGNNTPRFIDTFRFVSRSFKDIGDDLYINPIPVNDYLINGLNSGAYDAISSLLASNNFNFIALPNFINYRDKKEIESIFKPYDTYEKAKLGGSCGPAFVCVYAGEGSKHLDMNDSDYPNDGFDLRCSEGSLDVQNIPDDFTQDLKDFEDGLGVFTVKYSQQNQNIFKDIELDQNEFTETNESLQIQEAISQKGAETNRTIAGQNMFNVYSVRSYTATVEMMGNAMIQPMMYFQLDNIPMFHGGYLITRVKHKIVPNNMVTTFSGVRTKYSSTPLITAYDFYMSMAESIDTSSAGTGAVNIRNFVETYHNDTEANLPNDKTIIGTLSDISKKAITKRGEKEIINWQNGILKEKDGVTFLNIYAKETPGFTGKEYSDDKQPWSAIFISYIALAGDINFPKSTSHYNYITAGMEGVLGYEVFPLTAGLKIKAEVGDILNIKRAGNGGTASHSRIIYKVIGDIAYLIGGNESDTINVSQIQLSNGYIIDTTNVSNYRLLMKQTNNKYYKKKKIITTGDYSEDTKVGCPKISKKMAKQSSYKNSIIKLMNGTYNCTSNRDCVGSIDGFKQIPSLYSNNTLTKKGVIGLTQGLLEGFGSSPERKNPGNIRSGNGYKRFSTWKEGWEAYLGKLDKWVDGTVTPTKSASFVDCYSSSSNIVFLDTNVLYTDKTNYNYKTGSPSLRQFCNIYAPWGDSNNPTNYCATIAVTLKDYNYVINVDDKMNEWV